MFMYDKYLFKGFKPYLSEIKREDCSCGGHACSIITGTPIDIIKKLHPSNKDWSFDWVEAFLRLQHFELKEVPKNFDCKRSGFTSVFRPNHLMLGVLGVDKKELTWSVIYNKKIYHGQNVFKDLTMGEVLLNYPIQKLYLVYPAKL